MESQEGETCNETDDIWKSCAACGMVSRTHHSNAARTNIGYTERAPYKGSPRRTYANKRKS